MHGVIPAKLAAQPLIQRLPRVGKRTALLAGAALIGAAAIWYGLSWWTVGRFIQSTDDAYVGGEVTSIASKVPGFVQTVMIADNQSVKAGDLLIKLDDRDYRAQLARAEASVDAQNASVQRYQQADADHKKALAADQKARATLEAAERKLDVIEAQKQQARAA